MNNNYNKLSVNDPNTIKLLDKYIAIEKIGEITLYDYINSS